MGSIDLGEILKENYSGKIEVECPSPRAGNVWRLKSKGWIGFIALSSDLALRLTPKVSISNLFQMLEYACNFEIKFQDKLELIHCDAVESFYERLAYLLACQVLERVKKGLYRAYIWQEEDLSVVRGRINTSSFLRNPWNLKIKCDYQQYTGDVSDNRILAWTLYLIKHSGLCNYSHLNVLRAYKALCEVVELHPYNSEACINRTYNRLNGDYRPLHALCRFFLDSSSASLRQGEYSMISFLVYMEKLFEMFVASWLKKHPPEIYRIQEQDEFYIAPNRKPSRIDLVLYNIEEEKAYCVIDTKYKDKFYPEDLYQVVTCALAKSCNEAVLVYPEMPKNCPENLFPIQNIQIRILVFSLDNDLNDAGNKFKNSLLRT